MCEKIGARIVHAQPSAQPSVQPEPSAYASIFDPPPVDGPVTLIVRPRRMRCDTADIGRRYTWAGVGLDPSG